MRRRVHASALRMLRDCVGVASVPGVGVGSRRVVPSVADACVGGTPEGLGTGDDEELVGGPGSGLAGQGGHRQVGASCSWYTDCAAWPELAPARRAPWWPTRYQMPFVATLPGSASGQVTTGGRWTRISALGRRVGVPRSVTSLRRWHLVAGLPATYASASRRSGTAARWPRPPPRFPRCHRHPRYH